tara:strand:- start:232 stop:1140 length:909 start_codon:yes stop_codon:yes gene_type:complete
MNDGQLDDLIDYLRYFQISQQEELQNIEANVNSALLRIDNSSLQVESEIVRQVELIDAINIAPTQLPIVQEAVVVVSGLIERENGIDSDEDGLFDSVEVEISAYSASISESLGTQVLNLNPEEEESTPGRKDLSVVRGYLSQLQSSEINLGILVEGQEKFLNEATSGLAFLEEALENELWSVDFQEIAERTYEGDYDKAVRAVGIFNAYCARCHTAGYSAGAAYTKKIASGGLGPALRSGRANIQFKAREDMVDFIIKGSENGKGYGVNGVGGGKMPGFGAVLPESDIGLVIDYLRGMMPDA